MRGEAAIEHRVGGLTARELAPGLVLVMYSLVRGEAVHSPPSNLWRMTFHQGMRVG